MSEDEGSDVDTGLRMRDVRARAKALLPSVGGVSWVSFNIEIYAQLSVTEQVTDLISDTTSIIVKKVQKEMFLAITSVNSATTSLLRGTSDTTPQEGIQGNKIDLLMEQNNLLKTLYNAFETSGATLVDVQSDSNVFLLKVTNRNNLRTFWSAYKDGSLQSKLKEILITKDMEQRVGSSLYLHLHIEEKYYHEGLEFFGKQELRIVLVGRTGTGKSSTGNHILLKEKKGQHPFATSRGGSSLTQNCNYISNAVLGRNLVVVDTPGLFDTSRKNPEVLSEITHFILYTQPGPHAILLVMRAGTVTNEVNKTVELLVRLLKEGVYGYTIVLFTGKDKMEEIEMTLDDYLETLPPAVKNIINKCGDRCIAFNNKASGAENEAQVMELLRLIEDMVKKNGGNCYESEIHKVVGALVPEEEFTSDPETLREASRKENLEPGSWFWKAVTAIAALLGWDKDV